jgi:hypothetical protein
LILACRRSTVALTNAEQRTLGTNENPAIGDRGGCLARTFEGIPGQLPELSIGRNHDGRTVLGQTVQSALSQHGRGSIRALQTLFPEGSTRLGIAASGDPGFLGAKQQAVGIQE